MGDHVRLGEVAGRLEAPVELVEEAEIDVDLLVERAIEGTGRRARLPAAGVDRVAEEDELGALVGLPGGRELLLPEALGIIEDEGDEVDLLGLGVGGLGDAVTLPLAGRLREATMSGRGCRSRRSPPPTPEDEEEDDDDDEADRGPRRPAGPVGIGKPPPAAAAREAAAAASGPLIAQIGAALPPPPLHRSRTLSGRRIAGRSAYSSARR